MTETKFKFRKIKKDKVRYNTHLRRHQDFQLYYLLFKKNQIIELSFSTCKKNKTKKLYMSRKKKKTLKMKMRKGMHTGERVRSLERCRW